MAHRLNHINPIVGPYMSHIIWFCKDIKSLKQCKSLSFKTMDQRSNQFLVPVARSYLLMINSNDKERLGARLSQTKVDCLGKRKRKTYLYCVSNMPFDRKRSITVRVVKLSRVNSDRQPCRVENEIAIFNTNSI